MNRSFWRGLSFETKSGFAMVAVILVGVAGFFAAAGLTSVTEPAGDASQAGEVVLVETVTIERAVVKRVRVVRRVTERSGVRGKRVELVTVTTPARIERRLVPVVKKYLVTVPGPRRTIVETRNGKTRTRVVTAERIVTRERVVTNQQVRTVDQTVDRLVTTIHVTTQNVPVTQTLRTTGTVRVTTTVRLTDTVRSTDTVHVTETSAPVTVTVDLPVTVTVTAPPGKP